MVRNMIRLLLGGVAVAVVGPSEVSAEGLNPVATLDVDWLKEGQMLYRISSLLRNEVGSVDGQSLRATEKPPSLRGEPRYGSSQPRYFVWEANGGPRTLVLDASSGQRYDRLFVDQNGDGRLSESEQVRGWRRQENLMFGPVKVSIPTDHGPRTYHFLARCYVHNRSYQRLYLESACYYTGRLCLGDKSHKVALVDNNANGVFHDVSTVPGDGDRLLIDLNDDGQFAVHSTDDSETFPLSNLLPVGDTYLTLEVASDGSQLATAVAELKFGQVRCATGAFQVLLGSPEGILRVQTEDGQAPVPVGEYRLVMTSLTRTDEQGRRWELRSNAQGNPGSPVKIAEDKTTALPLGAPLQGQVRAYVQGREVSFSLQLTDPAGLAVSNISVDGQQPAPPKLHIRSTTGKEIGLYDFHYG